MKRGFLNNDKGKKAIARDESPKQPEPIHDTDVTMEDATSPSVSEHSTSTQKMDTTVTSVSPDSYDHSGGICDCLERAEKAGTLVPVNLHKAPPGMLGSRKQRRFVFRSWPRDPNGKVIHGKMTHRGKETAPWLEIWGETLYDFYKVCRIPGQESLQTLSSSSRLAAAMKELGELDAAKSELDWAEKEGDPHQVFPFSLKELVTDYESRAPVGDPNADDKLTRDRPILEDRLPFHLLPEKLIVHDPWDTLSVRSSRRSSPNNEKSWANMTDIVREYKLDLSSQGAKTREDDREAAKKDNSTEKWRQIQLLQSEDSGRAVNVLLPPRGKPLCVPEAHLYIRKEDLCGTGNHSIVYKVELEMPRAALIDEEALCESCFREAFEGELNARREAGTLFPPDAPMGNIKTEWVSAKSRESFFIKAEGFADAGETEMVTKSRRLPIEFYVGPTADVKPPLKYQNLARGPLCEHLAPSREEEKPEMIRVVVCAKLSLPDDRHLEREAANYQAFPRRFFEHWNGYQLVYPLHDPTPAGAVVPQFYGYYVPAEAEDEYRSPIMLLELCGKPVEMEELNYDERSAAAALYFYMQDGGWIQQSVAPRNIVMQPGPISITPKQRKSSKPSFRLIDFGRAHAWSSGMDAIREKEEVLEAFRLFDYA